MELAVIIRKGNEQYPDSNDIRGYTAIEGAKAPEGIEQTEVTKPWEQPADE